ncbi:hypothetical protein ETB97_007293 [Aspergillus alliaceus]|uniref:Aminotransferase class I/classII large domain-containing protein n=1 Tax=Petromyces alliaceus TaxID=209559 RepID=A0A8H5ZTD2_PETAA|nr:hypothetical protein ETB97_007293 [Aspergillus burnettii]
MVSITALHSPTGTVISRETLDQFVTLTKDRGCLLLVDETYRDITYSTPFLIAATLGDHVISVCSLSNLHGPPGIRIGWLVTKSSGLQETFLAAKEQTSVSGSVLDE